MQQSSDGSGLANRANVSLACQGFRMIVVFRLATCLWCGFSTGTFQADHIPQAQTMFWLPYSSGALAMIDDEPDEANKVGSMERGSTPPRPSTKATISGFRDAPVPLPAGKTIHERRPPPPVAPGAPNADPNPSPPVTIKRD